MHFKEIIDQAKSAVVLGLGTTGIATAQYFLRLKRSVFVIEKQTREHFCLKPQQARSVKELEKAGVTISFADQISDAVFALNPKETLVVISPGIPLTAKVAERLKDKKFRIIGELELGLGLSDVPQIIVTGSNGKSTCVSLIDAIAKEAGESPYLCGNIGNPILRLLEHEKGTQSVQPTVLVVEASSYQLESSTTLEPKVSVLLNLSENHLERHGSMANYLTAKSKVSALQNKNAVTVVNADDSAMMSLVPMLKSSVALFGKNISSDAAHRAVIQYDPSHGTDKIVIDSKTWGHVELECQHTKLVGEHARYNIAAASLAILSMFGASNKVVTAIKNVIGSFAGLEHRLQPVETVSGFVAINDSKSTTVASSLAALRSVAKAYPDSPIHLMLGGKVKLGSWKPLADTIHEFGSRVRVICFGGDGLFIQQELQQYGIRPYLAKNVAIATTYAADWIRDKEVVLFSPGCASFDEFSNFEDRGRFFTSVICRR